MGGGRDSAVEEEIQAERKAGSKIEDREVQMSLVPQYLQDSYRKWVRGRMAKDNVWILRDHTVQGVKAIVKLLVLFYVPLEVIKSF